MIMNNFFNVCYAKSEVKINVLISVVVYVDAIFLRGDDENGLFIIGQEEFRLSV